MLTRSRFVQFVIASALAFAGFAVPISPANATVNVAPNGTQVALGQSHVAAIDSAGKVWTWGRIYPGNGGSGTWDSVTRPEEVTLSGSSFAAVSVAAGEQSTLVATTSGDVYAWGYNGNGLGNGSGYQSPRSTPVKVSFPAGVRIVEVSGKCNGYLARSDQGAVYQWGSFYGMWNLSSTSPAIALAAGSVSGDSDKQLLSRGCSSAFAVKSDGSFFAWGANGGGKLGNGSTNDSATPVSVSIAGKSVTQISASSTHTLALTSDGFVYAWGGNSNGQLARNPSSTSFLSSPARVGAIANAVSVSASDSSPYSSFVSSAGVVSNWGSYFGSGSDASAYVPTSLVPPSDLATQLISGTGYQNGQAFVGQDGSIWTRGLYSNDGNCGTDANSYSMWVNGRMQTPRTFVRVFSIGQFGASYVEDQISINSLRTSSGATLGLDGSGVVTAFVGDEISLEASRPSSQCFSANELDYVWDLDGDGTFSDVATVTTDSFGNPTITGTAILSQAHSRSKGGLRISNEDGFSKTYFFDIRVVQPVQNSGPVDSQLPYVSSSENGPGAAVGTNGKLYSWGSADISQNGNSPLPSLVSLSDPDLQFSKVEVATSNSCDYGPCGSNLTFAVALSATGDLYVWGAGHVAHPGIPGSNSAIDTSAILTPSLVSSPVNGDPVVDYLVGSSRVVALTQTGQVWMWGRTSNSCQMTCTNLVVGPEVVSSLSGTENLAPTINSTYSFLYEIDGDWTLAQFRQLNGNSSNGLSLPSMQGAEEVVNLDYDSYIGLVDGNWKHEDGTSFVLPPGELVGMQNNQNLSAVMTDGSMWRYEDWGSGDPSWRRNLAPGIVARFAGENVGGWSPAYVSTAGEVIGAGGTCVGSDYDEGTSAAMFSDGNLGPQGFRDGQQIYLTSTVASTTPSQVYSFASSYLGIPSSVDGSLPSAFINSLKVNTSDSRSIDISIGSDCVSRSNIVAKADLDDDGSFETDLDLQPIPSGAPVDQYLGFNDGARRGLESVVLDLSNAGGRYIGIQVTSRDVYLDQDYVSSVRLPIVVEPVRPTGRYSGVSINRGAEFTESADVKLGLVWPSGAVTAEISNDGGFEVSRNVPLDASVNWRLSDLTSGKVGSSVYVKFLGLDATANGSWQETDIQPGPAYTDNITMDLTPPVVSAVEASVASAQSGALGFLRSFTSKIQSFVTTQSAPQQVARISIDATDAGSGVTAMQVTTDPAVPGAELPYQSSISMPVDKDTTAVRVKDSVGNWSQWKYVKIAGFIATTPSPSNPAPNQPSTPVTERPVTNPPAVGSVPAPAAAPAPVSAPQPMQVAVKAKASSVAVAAALGATIPAKAKVTLTVAKASKKICKVSGGKLVALKPGNCTVTVSVQAPKPKKGKKPKAVKSSGIVIIS